MADKITVDELKIFVGTGLKIKDTHKDLRPTLWSVSEDAFEIAEDGDGWPISFIGGTTFKPIVRPWSHLTKEIEVDGERFIPMFELYGSGDNDIEDGNFTFEDVFPSQTVMVYVDRSRVMVVQHDARFLRFNDATRLAAWGFDIFNWLNRTGKDGKPLAIEMETC